MEYIICVFISQNYNGMDHKTIKEMQILPNLKNEKF